MVINGNTKITGLFGHPVEHSLSPAMHNAGFKNLGLNFVYLPFDIDDKDLKLAVESIRVLKFAGVNVTIPHKQNVIPFLDKLSDEAKKIGAVNTIINKNGTLTGDNTDGKGFIKSFKEGFGRGLKNKQVFICGSGGAARSIVVSLLNENVKNIFLYDIVISKAQSLAKLDNKISVIKKENIKSILKSCEVIINTTPCGMQKNDNSSPFPLEFLPKNTLVYDIVYNRKTRLIKHCKDNKIKSVNGLEMLLYQGVLAFQAWTGKKAPINVMRKALISQINRG
jgi:shikimate dehydrogenase